MQIVFNVGVDDLEKGIEFYTTALGLRLVRQAIRRLSGRDVMGATSTISSALEALRQQRGCCDDAIAQIRAAPDFLALGLRR